MRKYDVAVKLRDAAFRMLSREGKLEEVGGGLKLVSLQVGALELGMRTPFQKMPGLKAPENYGEALQHSKLKELPAYGIDVWAGKKVFSVAWGGGDILTIISFKRGPWEADLMTVAGADSSPPP